jgi:hypothetical protein
MINRLGASVPRPRHVVQCAPTKEHLMQQQHITLRRMFWWTIAIGLLLPGATLAQQPAVVYVDGTNGSAAGPGDGWGVSAFRYLQDGIADAVIQSQQGPVQIWVAAGTYFPDESAATPNGSCELPQSPGACDRAVAFVLHDDVAMYGGFAGNEMNLSQRSPRSPGRETYLSGDLFDNDDWAAWEGPGGADASLPVCA